MSDIDPTHVPSPQDEVVQICRELIRIDSSNYGDGSGPGERAAAEYVMGLLTEVGLDPQLTESDPGRASVVVRTEGRDPSRPGLVLHGHLDVVPAQAADWSVDPFAAEVRDGLIWGRGAVDMKDMDAMLLANLRHLARTGQKPPRDIVWAFFADEEAGGVKGAGHVVAQHPEWFEGCTEAISEVGGFSITLEEEGTGAPIRAYLLQTAEKGIAWLRLHAHGRAGHGSVPNPENAVVRLAEAIARIDAHEWPRSYVASVRELFDGVSGITGRPWAEDDVSPVLECLGGARRFVEGTLQDTSNFTMLTSGYKHNVIPQTATAALDCRFLPGHEEELMDTVRELAGEHVEVEIVHKDVALEAPSEGELVESMKRALLKEDPGARVLPYCLSGGTDNKHLSRLGITGYGFAPLQLPPELDFVGMFHGVDERVPVDAVEFGARVLQRLIEDC
ncbi:M20/M25/M40 family metallo-hydrolase [Ornithinicoccus hortensis]|uniref:Acetylornithine deacetylase/succinyl-diaminopimelate desuccinylase-like protein n=1 Tax=Ornithinicoccus hortensis TaxID=82346 RepID=A0A542YSY1_9MICO|nr:M20/M25/M40 family metallo-hydrolase [Ornithinicoccus hortensis]TQL51161.1 acetylornithine deacetylase/succinyl-diaminopimelate desuccinylase-like protein [Ornithinicoccus hortensis]